MKLRLDALLESTHPVDHVATRDGLDVFVAGHLVCADSGEPLVLASDDLRGLTVAEAATHLHSRVAGDAVLAIRRKAAFALLRPAFSELPLHYRFHAHAVDAWTGLELPRHLRAAPPPFDLDALATMVHAGAWMSPSTGLQGVSELLSGSALLCIDGIPRQVDLLSGDVRTLCAATDADTDYARQLQRFRRLITRSVAHKTLGCGGRFSIEASGGLDSSVLTVAAAALNPGAPLSLINSYSEQDPHGDERLYFDALASHVGAGRALVDTHAWARRDSLSPELLAPTARPCKMAPAAATAGQMFARAHADGSVMVLTGDGGDQLFLRTRRAYIAREMLSEAATAREAALAPIALAMQERCTVWSIAHEIVTGRIARQYRQRFLGAAAVAGNPLSDLRPPAGIELVPGVSRLGGLPASRLFQFVGMRMAELNRIQVRGCPVTERKPFVFWPLIRAALRAKRAHHFAGGQDRALQRDAFRDALPPIIYHRASKGAARDLAERFDHEALTARLLRSAACRYHLVSTQRLLAAQRRPADAPTMDALLRAATVADWMGMYEAD